MSEEPAPPTHSSASASTATATAPGPRATRLQEIYSESLTRTLNKLSYENIAPCYPTISRRAEPVLRQVQSQMVQKLREKSEKEFQGILEARGVVDKLNALEGVIGQAQLRMEKEEEKNKQKGDKNEEVVSAPPHLLPPQDILKAHLAPHLASQQSLLNARLQTTQAQNALLADHIRQQRQELDELLDALEHAVEDVRGANAVLGGVADELAVEARNVDADLKGLNS
ncbi:hypothetical protein QQS21_009390 [Conoideocrella luteorostrata]|uniref:Nnf1-domain-containing protein n=1 Tax=Conoideocrella luteorostrata TaxID=1105319 RepID=A0AAJ0CGZ5_9HYPO|nr:hypothetical protein QQS21_009390 [Conoideocrella luteorostrata]